MDARFVPDLLVVKPLRDLSPAERDRFFAWIEGLTLEDDREDGPGFARWLRHHEATPGDCVWAFYDPNDGGLVGTASLVSQDQQLAALPGGCVIGGVNIVRERRGQGIGTAVMSWLDAELLRRAKAAGQVIPVVLQADNPVAVRLYARFGFVPVEGRIGIFSTTYGPHSPGGAAFSGRPEDASPEARSGARS